MLTLTLEVFKHDDSLRIGLFEQSQTAPTLRHYSQVGVSFSEIGDICSEMVGILNSLPRDVESKAVQLKNLQRTGRLLWDHLLSRSVKEKLKNIPSCTLILSLDEELIYIPWELIFDGESFLCLKFSLGRLIRSKSEPGTVQYRGLTDKPRMLILANPNGDLKSAYAEGINIRNQFNHKTKKVHIDFKSTNIDKNYIKKNICDYDIVHFAGHCEYDKKRHKESGWVLSDGIFKTEDILKMGQSLSLPALIFSNACHSAQAKPAVLDPDYQKDNYGMANAFLFSGVRHFIGSIRKIEDSVSFVFAREFYANFISGLSVGGSLRASKLKLVKEYGLASLHWVNYLLYGDPGFVFFKTPRNEHRVKPAVFNKKFIIRLSAAIVSAFAAFSFIFLLPKINPGKIYLILAAESSYRKGDNQAAIGYAERALTRDQFFLSAYPVAANAYYRLGNKEKALKYYYEYVLKSERLGNKTHLIQAYIKLGWFYHLDGEFQKALELYNKALSLSRRQKDKISEAVVLRKLAVWHIDKKDYAQALDLLTKSASINQENSHNFENAKNLASDYFDIGLVYANKEDFAAAKDFYEKSLRLFLQLRLDNELSDCYFNLGEIFLYEKEYQKALDYYLKGLGLDKKHGNKLNMACDYNMIGELYVDMEDPDKAEEYFNMSLELSTAINSRTDLADASYNLGLLSVKKGRKNKTREYWRKAQEVYITTDPQKYQEIRTLLQNLDSS